MKDFVVISKGQHADKRSFLLNDNGLVFWLQASMSGEFVAYTYESLSKKPEHDTKVETLVVKSLIDGKHKEIVSQRVSNTESLSIIGWESLASSGMVVRH